MRLLFWKLDLIVIYWIYFYNRKFVNLLGQVIWYHDDQPVKESADFQLLFQGDKCSLVIHEAFLDDAGVYKVVAINSGGEASSQCTLTVTRKSNHWIFRYLINYLCYNSFNNIVNANILNCSKRMKNEKRMIMHQLFIFEIFFKK